MTTTTKRQPAALEDLLEDGRDLVTARPYASVLAALGVGYVLGGGLFSRLTARLVGAALVGVRIAAAPVLRREILEVLTQVARPAPRTSQPHQRH